MVVPGDCDCEEHGNKDGERRDDPPDTTPVEGAERHAAGAVMLTQKDGGDEEAAEDEEQVDAELPVRRERERVDADDEHDRDGAEPVD